MTDKSLEEKASRPADKDNADEMHMAVDNTMDNDTTPKEGKRDADKDNSESINLADKSVNLGTEDTKTKSGKRPADKDNAQPMVKAMGVDDMAEAKVVFEQATPEVALSEDIKALLESLELPEEFKTKAVGMFEAAITLRVADIKKEMFAVNEAKMDEYKTSLATKIEEDTDTYVSEAVAKWIQENELAVKSNTKTQIAESFMANLLNLLEAHYITVPEGKEDILETTLAKADALQLQLEEQVKANTELKESMLKVEKSLVVESIVKSLTDTQAEKIRSLSEGVTFEAKESFKVKLEAIVESITKGSTDKPSSALLEDVKGEIVIKEETKTPKANVHPFVQRMSDDLKALAK